jgi:hypothetical protein
LILLAGYTNLPSKQLLDAGLIQIADFAKLSKRLRSDPVGLKLAFYMGYCYFCRVSIYQKHSPRTIRNEFHKDSIKRNKTDVQIPEQQDGLPD